MSTNVIQDKLPVQLTGTVSQVKVDGQPPAGHRASLHLISQPGDEQVEFLATVRAYPPPHHTGLQCDTQALHVLLHDRLQQLTAPMSSTTQPGSSKSTLQRAHTWAEPASCKSVPACMHSNLGQQIEACTIIQIMKPSLSHYLILCEVQSAQSVRSQHYQIPHSGSRNTGTNSNSRE